MSEIVQLIGTYEIDGQKDVHLIELGIEKNHQNIDVGQITQAQEGIDKMNWQTPWDEKFLNFDGTMIIGDWMDTPKDTSNFTRLAFFLHFLNFEKPLLTQFGEIDLIKPVILPDRLRSIITYEKPN
ncbi:hypothetical protein [Flagellimonas allohymeniacidonis]|uniref:Uncharacterized protein n=1 Tax=Flagellimonas allohymeniacidonis TaxID=2517819 RepID=A0A4Q8Q9K4_9FLAO|nr:hypothetical protein [Allomuricauda hymeniacidonis]TAI46952.1 hypothetical protein EW142_09640 [Allomuricauda hymeniacidonis]